jgi:hypothetical protein
VWAAGDGSFKSVSDSSFKFVSSWTSGKDIVVPGREEFVHCPTLLYGYEMSHGIDQDNSAISKRVYPETTVPDMSDEP